ncbi:MAG: hypothetical protein ACKOUT_15290 [Novosphingobium sp.]
MKRLALAALVACLILGWFSHDVVEFISVDGCLDSGGAWDYQFEKCTNDR